MTPEPLVGRSAACCCKCTGTVRDARRSRCEWRSPMGLAEYMIVAKGHGWSVLHDGVADNEYATKEAAFESAVAAASLAVREGHEVHVGVPGRDSGNGTALGARD